VSSALAQPSPFDLSGVERAIGPRSWERGLAYARRGRVIEVEWDPGARALTGAVAGQGALYETVGIFRDGAGGALEFEEGNCSCPVGWNCKHVAALVVAAASGRAQPATVRDAAEPAAWERPLRALLEAPLAQPEGTPLAVELSIKLTGGGGAPRLFARLMRPGKRGWINGQLTWSDLDYDYGRGHRSDHRALARELLAAQRARRGAGSSRYYYYGADKALDLSDCSPRLWSLLDEAARTGLALIHADHGLGELPRHREGEVVLDVTRPSEGHAEVRALLRVELADAARFAPVLFLGADGHGIVLAERGSTPDLGKRRLVLVHLARPAPPALQRLVLRGERLAIPPADLERFAAEVSPGLQRVAAVISSDRSFEPPEVSAPALVLRVRYSERHAVEIGWEWAYRVGTSERRVPLAAEAEPAGLRDPDSERELLAAADLAGTGLERFGLLDERGRPARSAPIALIGLESMRFTTELLPSLRDDPRVAVEVDGEPPDYRDVSDSLEIGVSTFDVDGERDWFDLGVTIRVDGRELPFAEVFAALASGRSHMLLDDGGHFSLEEPRLTALRELIEEARALADEPSASPRISRWQAGLWEEIAALGVVEQQAESWQRRAGALLELDTLAEQPVPAALAAELRPYQRDGFAWLATLWQLELGGILADDMGLGKTLQTLALIVHARERDPACGPFLVVAPTSVVPGWVSEAARFAPSLTVAAATDTLAKSGRTIDELAAADVVVTTYTLLRLDAEAYGSVEWAAAILDEAQYVKNHQAKTYRCVRELNAPFKLALTGTPMENNLMELWSLLSIAAPGLFPDPKRFAERYARPIERSGDRERLARLRRRIKPLVKRRTKELVARDLPAKQEQTLEVELHARHRKLYDTYLQRERQKILGLLGDLDRNRFTILRSITLLRQLSLHPALVDPERSERTPCAKLEALVEQLADVVGGGHRALVFSQFTGFLARVRDGLDREGIGYQYLDGRTRRRDRVLERFKTGDDPVFLISLKAGGLGLNLTEADYCFLLDPWWNPAVESQAIDRTHRIGQTRPVMVYRLVARDTIEEKVVALARRKAALFKGVVDDGDLFASSMTADDIRALVE